MRFIKGWRRISHVGVNDSTRFADAKYVIQTNQIAIIAFIFCSFVFFNYWVNNLRSLAYLQIVTNFLFLLPLCLNYYKKFRLAKIALVLSANISTFISSSILGYDSGEHYAYFGLMIVTLIIFDRKEKLLMLFFSFLSSLCLIILELTDYSLFSVVSLSDHIEGSIRIGNIFTASVIILLVINYFRNISEQHIDSIIQKTYEELKAIFNNSHDAIFVLDPQTKIIAECNDRALEIFGFPTRADILGQLFFSLQQDTPDANFIANIEQSIVLDKRWISDEKYIRQDGKEFWGNLALTSVELEDKKILVARITDITENKQFSILLENMTYDLKKVQKIAKLGYWHLDVNTNKVTYCSEEVCKQFSMTGEFEAIPFSAFITQVYPKDLPRLTTAVTQSLTKQEPFEIEFRVGTQDNLKWIFTKSDLVINENGEVEKIICTSLDITERKKAEERLKASERNYRKLASNIPDTDIFLFDNNLKIILAEGTIMQKHGLGPNFFEGKSVDDILDIAYKEQIRPLYLAVLKGEQFSADIALRDEFLNMRGVPLRDSNQVISGGLMVSQDITLRKRNEQELIKAKEEAEKASMAKAQFLSTMSHELRTPLNAVIGISHLLLQENPRQDQIEDLHILRFSAENLLVLINDILDFSKIEAGKIELEEIEFNISDLLRRIIQTQKLRAEEKRLQLTLKIAEDVPDVVSGDPTKLSQVMNNLISNAIKFTEQGGVFVKVGVQEKTKKFITLFFAVKDTGVGIPKEKLDTIFEQFSQADSNTTRKFGGTGLGLTITKKLLELQKSEIRVKSELNEGSIFYFSLKFKISQTLAEKPDKTSPLDLQEADFQGIKVLLVEDNQANVLIAGKFIKKWNLDFDHAENGQIAVEKAATQHYDLILMDLQMPVMDGYQAAAEIRTFNQTVPIIALTASAMIETQIKVKAAGMNEIVTKPFNPADLYQKIIEWTKLKSEIKS